MLRALIFASLLASGSAWAGQETAPAAEIELAPAKLDVAKAVAGLPRESVQASAHGKTASYEGYDLLAVLKAVGQVPAGETKGLQLRRLVRVSARDGYQVVFALAELDATLGNRKVLLVDRENGQPLADSDGPWRLVVPTDARQARWIRQVSRIAVAD